MLWRRRRREQDLVRELRSHLELEAEELGQSGREATDAWNAARRQLGNTAYIQEEVRRMWGWAWFPILVQDFRYGLRQLRRTPAFASVVIVTLALGIGANTAIFSAMNAILLRYLPVSHPEQLVYLSTPGTPGYSMQSGDGDTSLPEPLFEELRAQPAFAELAAFVPLAFGRVPVRFGAVAEEAQVDMVSGNFFSGLGVGAVRGRLLSMADERGHTPVAVLSESWWARRFARDPSILGQVVYVKGIATTIVGVAASGFAGVEHSHPTDLWIPLQTNALLKPWGQAPESAYNLYGSPTWWCLKTIGRLTRGVTARKALAQLNPVFQRAIYPNGKPPQDEPLLELHLVPARGLEGTGESYRQPLTALMAMVGMILAIACVNVALLLVARNAARRREFALRLALGGSRGRLFRQLLTESLLLVGAGSGLGWCFSVAATRALALGWGLDFDLTPDLAVLLFTLTVSAAAALLFGLAPWRAVLRIPIGSAVKSSSANAGQERAATRGTQFLVALQMSLCLVLLVSAGLLVETLRNLENTRLGMRASGLLVFGIDPQGLVHSDSSQYSFYRALIERLRSVPGVESATLMGNRLGAGWSNNSGGFLIDGKTPAEQPRLRWNRVGADYFRVLEIPVMHGREFSDADSPVAPKVAVVNQAFAQRYFRDRDPLGHTVALSDKLAPYTIVGVARDSKYTGVTESVSPTAYFPNSQSPGSATMQVEVRTAGPPLTWIPAVRHAVAEFGPDLALLQPMSQQEQFEGSYAQQRLFGRLAILFGSLAILLVATGLYGTMAYSTSLRVAEVGVRMALGAQRRQVLWMVLRDGLRICAASLAIGLPAAILAARYLRNLLYGVASGDPFTYVAAAAGILAVALLASLIPARRAASVDPMVALRHD